MTTTHVLPDQPAAAVIYTANAAAAAIQRWLVDTGQTPSDDVTVALDLLETALRQAGHPSTTTAPDRQPSTPGQALRMAADRWLREAGSAQGWDPAGTLAEWADELDAAPATDPHRLPDCIRLDLVRWHCTRCNTRSTWVRDPHDPLVEAAAEAWGHQANHEQWAAERLSTAPPAGTEGT